MNTEILKDWSLGNCEGVFANTTTCPEHSCSYCEDNKVSGCKSGTTSCVVRVVKDFDKFEKLINLLGDVNETT